ncbi:DNA methyltransferase C1 [Paraliobacillus quinghaiensis]|uniref:Methyltransferase n=1 Tax=Paraliobacillus quinghaiensis TaxID=470815 RepID=A0A917WYM6_9BACI|nr:DNA methyltransferase [Paraliobacillus quinghaiensis]GGM40488.1 DNA methyltransferase C1 [Paraliobacillus quinghaiensis]
MKVLNNGKDKEQTNSNVEEVIECFNLPENEFIKDYDTFSIMEKKVTDYTHIMHKYPSKYIPQVPRWAIEQFSNEGDIVLDPFLGSGTTAIESMVYNRNGIGLDVNPIARLISKVKTTPINPKLLSEQYSRLLIAINNDPNLKEEVIPETPNISKWFTEESIYNLSRFKFYINQIENDDIRDFFLGTFSAIIRKCSNAEYRSQKTYISSRFRRPPANVFDMFDRRFNQYLQGMTHFYNEMLEKDSFARVVEGSADNFDLTDTLSELWGREKIDLAITSPPYVTAVEYPAVFKLEYQWLGYFADKEINEHRKNYIGTDRYYADQYKQKQKFGHKELDKQLEEIFKINNKKSYIIYKFFEGMRNNIKSVANHLKKNGKYVIVVGNNTVLNFEIPINEYLIDIAEEFGFKLEKKFSYVIKDRHLVFPRNGRGGIINKDWMIVLNKED